MIIKKRKNMTTNHEIRKHLARYDRGAILDHYNSLRFTVDNTDVNIQHVFDNINNIIVKSDAVVEKPTIKSWDGSTVIDTNSCSRLTINNPLKTFLQIIVGSIDLTNNECYLIETASSAKTSIDRKLVGFINGKNNTYPDERIQQFINIIQENKDSIKNYTWVTPDNYVVHTPNGEVSKLIYNIINSIYGVIVRKLYDVCRFKGIDLIFYPFSNYTFLISDHHVSSFISIYTEVVKELIDSELEVYFLKELFN